MKGIFKSLIIIVTVFFSLNILNAQENSIEKITPFSFNASYIGDVVSNFRGGIKKGSTYLGIANMRAGFSTETANLWKGGNVFVNIGNTHGGEPSATLVGDFQGISNIEAGNLAFMYELWYKQSVGKFNFTLGLQDLNSNYAVSENGALFNNSSFGIHSNLAENVPTAIFPLTALGISVKWSLSDSFLWEAAVFDGTPDDFETNPYNIHWKLSKNQGFLTITEFQIRKSLLKGKEGNYKFGFYFHEHNDTIDAIQKNGGAYFNGDQQINNKLSVLLQIGESPRTLNVHNHYYGLGLNYKGLFNSRSNDLFGVAIAYAGIDDKAAGSETVIELAYRFELNKNIYMKPDIQYVINPAGITTRLDNALVGSLRFGLEF